MAEDEQGHSSKKTCFVIAPIGDDGSPVRVRSDKVFRHVIKPAVEECGYVPLRSDIEPTPGMIGHQIINHLIQDDLVVADLTGQNANVFYELAIRHMVRKPVVQIIQKGEALPFDITQSRTIFLDHTDLDSADTCRREMITQIRELERDPTLVENPISQAMRIESLLQSSDPDDRRDAEMLRRLDRLASQVEMLLLEQQVRRRPEPRDVMLADAPIPAPDVERAPMQQGAGPVFGAIPGTAVTLEQAIRTFEMLRDAGRSSDTNAAAQRHGGSGNGVERPISSGEDG